MCFEVDEAGMSCERFGEFMMTAALAKAAFFGVALVFLSARLGRLVLRTWRKGQLQLRAENVVTRRRAECLLALVISLCSVIVGQSYDVFGYRLRAAYDVRAGLCASNRTAMFDRTMAHKSMVSVLSFSTKTSSTLVVLLLVFLLWLDLIEQASMDSFRRQRAVLFFCGCLNVSMTALSIGLSFRENKSSSLPEIIVGTFSSYSVYAVLLYYSRIYGRLFTFMLQKTGSTTSKMSIDKVGQLVRTNTWYIILSIVLSLSVSLGSQFDGIDSCIYQWVVRDLLTIAWVLLANVSIAYYETSRPRSSNIFGSAAPTSVMPTRPDLRNA